MFRRSETEEDQMVRQRATRVEMRMKIKQVFRDGMKRRGGNEPTA